MLARAALAVLAVLAIAWLGVLYRDVRIGQAATDVLLTDRHPSHAEVNRQVDRLRDAKLLNPDRQWDQKIAFFLMVDRPREALWIANEMRGGLEVIASGETLSGATRFASGVGRHGAFASYASDLESRRPRVRGDDDG